MKRKDLYLLPAPSVMNHKEGFYYLQNEEYIFAGNNERETIFSVCSFLKKDIYDILNLNSKIEIKTDLKEEQRAKKQKFFEDNNYFKGVYNSEDSGIRLIKKNDLSSQEYILQITPKKIIINFGKPQGAFYATRTLKQLLIQCGNRLPCLYIKDCPDFSKRSVMLDVSRNKIPRLKTLFGLINMLADLKYNQLQLYIEGFSFAYSSFPGVWAYNTPLTGEEIMKLDAYCRERFIELVPNQNSFGHMSAWLQRGEFNHLAECPQGFTMDGCSQPPGTLNPVDPASKEFLGILYDDLLPYFSSDKFNVGCDETYELGRGKSKEKCESQERGKVYLDFLLDIYRLVRDRGKTMMFWGDIILKYPQLIKELPSDMIALDWGYEAEHPFAEETEKFSQAGIPFYVCGGTSSWNSILGRTRNMKENLRQAALYGRTNGARGFMVTDWGDNGHWQFLPVSYPGFVMGAAVSWNEKQSRNLDISIYLDRFIFEDGNEVMGKLLCQLGNYYLHEGEKKHNITRVVEVLSQGFQNMKCATDNNIFNIEAVKKHIEQSKGMLNNIDLNCSQANLIIREIETAILIVEQGIALAQFQLSLEGKQGKKEPKKEFKAQNPKKGAKKLKMQAISLRDEMDSLIKKYKKLWLTRNRFGELENSLERFYEIKRKYESFIKSDS